jgi:hypothetical protein
MALGGKNHGVFIYVNNILLHNYGHHLRRFLGGGVEKASGHAL